MLQLSDLKRVRDFATRPLVYGVIIILGLTTTTLNFFGKLGGETEPAILGLLTLILIYVLAERSAVLEQISAALKREDFELYTTKSATYAAASSAISNEKENREILWTVFHGTSDHNKRSADPNPSPQFFAFRNTMEKCIASRGDNGWRMRILNYASCSDELERIIERTEEWGARFGTIEGVEVKVYATETGLPRTIMPLIVGRKHVIYGIDDVHYYGVSEGFMLKGAESADMARRYFNSVWEDKNSLLLRNPSGIDQDVANVLRAKFSKSKGRRGNRNK